MNGAEAKDKVAAVDADDFAAGEMFGDRVEGDAVIGIVKNRDEDEFVGDVEIGVAGGKTLAVEKNRGGHGKFFDAQRLAVLIFGLLEKGKIFLQMRVIRIGRILFDDGEDG